jgi:hypothetical protein
VVNGWRAGPGRAGPALSVTHSGEWSVANRLQAITDVENVAE